MASLGPGAAFWKSLARRDLIEELVRNERARADLAKRLHGLEVNCVQLEAMVDELREALRKSETIRVHLVDVLACLRSRLPRGTVLSLGHLGL